MGDVTLTYHTVFKEGSADPTVHDPPKASTFVWYQDRLELSTALGNCESTYHMAAVGTQQSS